MVAETKPGNRDKEEKAEEGRSLKSRRVIYTVNQKTALKKKINHAERYHYALRRKGIT